MNDNKKIKNKRPLSHKPLLNFQHDDNFLYDDYVLYHKDSDSDNNSENSGKQTDNNDKTIDINSTRSSMLGKDKEAKSGGCC